MLNDKFSGIGADGGKISNLLGDCCCAFQEELRPRKRQQIGEADANFTAEIAAEIPDRHGNLVPIQASPDSGTTKSIVLRKHVRKGRAKPHKGKHTTWKTLGGVFSTNQKALLGFKFPELSKNKAVTWIFQADSAMPKNKAMHDMIVGPDPMAKIGICANTKDKNVCWEGSTTPPGRRGEPGNQEKLHQACAAATVPPAAVEAKERQARMLDANHKKVKMAEFAKELWHLNDKNSRRCQPHWKNFPPHLAEVWERQMCAPFIWN